MLSSLSSLHTAVIVIVLTLCTLGCDAVLRKRLFNFGSMGVSDKGDPGQPLFLTPYIRSGNLDTGRRLAKVGPLAGTQVESYSGYLTVNSSCNSNMFFWFFPAQNGDKKAPVLLWLQGGPGGTSMFGLFNEHGPFKLQKDLTLVKRPYTWTSKYSIVYIGN